MSAHDAHQAPAKSGIIRRLVVIGVPIGLIVGGAFAAVQVLTAMKPVAEKVADEPTPIAVQVVEAKQTDLALKVYSQGEVRALREIALAPQVSGMVEWVAPNFVEGGIFKAGDPLLRIEDADYELALVRAQARLAQAAQLLEREEAEAALARKEWDELGEGEASPLTLREPQLAQARAELAAAEADIRAAELNLRRTVIKAPFDGRVRTKSVDMGALVAPGVSVGSIFSTDVALVRLPLTDADLARLNLPLAFAETDDEPGPDAVLRALVAGEQRSWPARIVRTDAAIDPATRTLSAIAQVNDPYGAAAEAGGAPLAVGLFVEAEMVGRVLEDVVVAPRTALRGANTVYVVNDASMLELRQVEVAHSNVERAAFSGGVAPGELVTDSPIDNPSAGMLVTAFSGDPALDDRVAALRKARDDELARRKAEREAEAAAKEAEDAAKNGAEPEAGQDAEEDEDAARETAAKGGADKV